ncbi:MAG: phosphoribosylglycinamide formyltransferase [Thermomonas sp.]|uniref:phosphoribosylglycinamide formyltransferase n=1 Tax=Thermomonas sp. TaxID=1971895 RepID=UPI002606D727|nr:phosphoribosylglycinamide formyltransferase [Thermomonas sp.]MCC7095775.1 phosphoribosylglycinamide formyltransferase [Thermomonas sp.]
MTLRLAVLASGRGSNLQAILDAISAGTLDAHVVGVFSDRPDAAALQRVTESLRWSRRPKDFTDRTGFDAALADAVAACQPDWIVCAGYMRILGGAFVNRFPERILNIHPSLLPKYKGLHTHQRALDAGDTEHGASVHLVNAALDAGQVLAQARVPVLPGDNAEVLAARVLTIEHPLYLHVLQLLAIGRLRAQAGQLQMDGHPVYTPLSLESAHS